MKADDFCSKYEPWAGRADFDEAAMRQLTVMAKQLRNGYPVLPLPENLEAFQLLLSDAKAPKNTTTADPQG